MPLDDVSVSSITNHVMLVTLSISVFSGEKIDQGVAEEVASNHGAKASDVGRFNKQIISKTALENIRKVATAARMHHYSVTLPWSDVGQRLLGVQGYLPYMVQMQKLKDQFDEEVDRFVDIYPTLIDEARTRLNTLFDPDQYPPVSELRRRFTFDFAVLPLPDSRNWFLDIAADEMANLKRLADERVDQAVKEAVSDVYRRVMDHAKRVHEKLTNYEVDPETGKVIGSIFRDSLIENLKGLVDLLPSLNVTKDPELDALAIQMKEITRYSAKALRADAGFRKDAADKAQAIYDRASKFFA